MASARAKGNTRLFRRKGERQNGSKVEINMKDLSWPSSYEEADNYTEIDKPENVGATSSYVLEKANSLEPELHDEDNNCRQYYHVHDKIDREAGAAAEKISSYDFYLGHSLDRKGDDYTEIDEPQQLRTTLPRFPPNRENSCDAYYEDGDPDSGQYYHIPDDIDNEVGQTVTRELNSMLSERNGGEDDDENPNCLLDGSPVRFGELKGENRCTCNIVNVLIVVLWFLVLLGCILAVLQYFGFFGCYRKGKEIESSKKRSSSTMSKLQNMMDEIEKLDAKIEESNLLPNHTELISVEKEHETRHRIVDLEVEKLVKNFSLALEAVKRSQMAENDESEFKLRKYDNKTAAQLAITGDAMVQLAINNLDINITNKINNIKLMPGPKGEPGIPGIYPDCQILTGIITTAGSQISLSATSASLDKTIVGFVCFCDWQWRVSYFKERNGYRCDIIPDNPTKIVTCKSYTHICQKRPKPDD